MSGLIWVQARLLHPSAHSCFLHRVPYRTARSGVVRNGGVVRKSRDWVLEKKERRRRQGK